MNQEDPLEIIRQCNALISGGHFVLKTQDHSDTYVRQKMLIAHPLAIHCLCNALARHFADNEIDVVIGPVTGGAILSTWTAHYLTELIGSEVLSTYAEEVISSIVWFENNPESPIVGHKFVIPAVYRDYIKDKRILVVEDVLTTGTSARQVIQAVREINGHIVGLGAIVNRGDLTKKALSEIPKFVSLVDMPLETWKEQDCPLCKQGIPINEEVGYGRQFLARKGIKK